MSSTKITLDVQKDILLEFPELCKVGASFMSTSENPAPIVMNLGSFRQIRVVPELSTLYIYFDYVEEPGMNFRTRTLCKIFPVSTQYYSLFWNSDHCTAYNSVLNMMAFHDPREYTDKYYEIFDKFNDEVYHRTLTEEKHFQFSTLAPVPDYEEVLYKREVLDAVVDCRFVCHFNSFDSVLYSHLDPVTVLKEVCKFIKGSVIC